MWVHILIYQLAIAGVYGIPTTNFDLERPERIVGGRPAEPGAFPYQVSIQKKAGFSSGFYHSCGGALVEPDIVVTAAHCVKNQGGLYVAAGMNNIQHSKRNRVKVIDKRISNYNEKNKENDIAILKLEKKMTISRSSDSPIDVIRLPPKGYQPRGSCAITGWGKTKYGGATPRSLHTADVKIVSHTKCKELFPKQYRIGDNMLCAGGGKRDACQGDSGGPMACFEDENELVLTGITSWGVGCATPKIPGVYTEVSKYTEWIQSSIESLRQEEESRKKEIEAAAEKESGQKGTEDTTEDESEKKETEEDTAEEESEQISSTEEESEKKETEDIAEEESEQKDTTEQESDKKETSED